MVGERQRPELTEVLNENQIRHILKQSLGNVQWILEGSEIRSAADGIAGFLGDHMKATVHVDVHGQKKKIHLFIKRVPTVNKPKAGFIEEKQFFKREKMMFDIFNNFCDGYQNPWYVRAYIHTDDIIVMPDISIEGYKNKSSMELLDSQHVFLSVTAIASFHATFFNYETEKSLVLKRPYNINQEQGELLEDAFFLESPFLNCCSKLSANMLKTFSTKAYRNLPDIEIKLQDLYLEACDRLREYKDTVNVLLHRDLWLNNIMYKYHDDNPINSVLIDYQCLRYGPPTIDLMIFLYLTTDSRFREEKEKDVFDHYYSVFRKNLSYESKQRLEGLTYDKESFFNWCEKSRMSGMMIAIGIFPLILMDPKAAQDAFDNPDNFDKHFLEDRSVPVLAQAMKSEQYKLRNLAVIEEFVERYLLK